MRWSWKLGQFRGIAVYVHATFLLLLGWILASHLLRGHGWGAALSGTAFIVLLFACVVLHEFGHALTAQRYGIQTRDITLYPIGGVARLERIPRNPQQELLIALAGPAVNLVIAGALFIVLGAVNALSGVDQFDLMEGNLFQRLAWINLSLALFNLLPAFPMDGGRVLRALLARRMEYGRATRTAATVGQAMAFLFGFLGLMTNPFLLFIAFFVYMGAAQEANMVEAELAFQGVPTRRAMMTQFNTVTPEDTLSHAVDLLLCGAQHDFPVVRDGGVVGMLTRERLVAALGQSGPDGRVEAAMTAVPVAAFPNESLERSFQRLREADARTVPVMEDGRLVGLLTLENVGELLMVRQAIDLLPPAPAGPSGGLVDEAGEAFRLDENRTRPLRWVPRRRARG